MATATWTGPLARFGHGRCGQGNCSGTNTSGRTNGYRTRWERRWQCTGRCTADVDADGHMDVIATDLWLNQGRGSGWSFHDTGIPGGVHDMQAADFNGDGKPDILALISGRASPGTSFPPTRRRNGCRTGSAAQAMPVARYTPRASQGRSGPRWRRRHGCRSRQGVVRERGWQGASMGLPQKRSFSHRHNRQERRLSVGIRGKNRGPRHGRRWRYGHCPVRMRHEKLDRDRLAGEYRRGGRIHTAQDQGTAPQRTIIRWT